MAWLEISAMYYLFRDNLEWEESLTCLKTTLADLKKKWIWYFLLHAIIDAVK